MHLDYLVSRCSRCGSNKKEHCTTNNDIQISWRPGRFQWIFGVFKKQAPRDDQARASVPVEEMNGRSVPGPQLKSRCGYLFTFWSLLSCIIIDHHNLLGNWASLFFLNSIAHSWIVQGIICGSNASTTPNLAPASIVLIFLSYCLRSLRLPQSKLEAIDADLHLVTSTNCPLPNTIGVRRRYPHSLSYNNKLNFEEKKNCQIPQILEAPNRLAYTLNEYCQPLWP